ncbi:MAG: polyA polymerase family protein, partial [Acidobacteria bacterium]|nr:polyA polymerase family protein [Acidobacteriota bacterium]
YRVVDGGHVYDFADILDADIDADLARRDFTINAMAVDLAGGALLDPHGARRDLAARVVRMVRASNFDDDPLRMLKGVRMAVRLDFDFDPETLEAMRSRAAQLTRVAAERVTYELSLIFSAGRFARSVRLLRETGLETPLELATGDHAIDDVSYAGALALLVRDPRSYAERWRWSDALLRDVLALQRLVDKHAPIDLFDAGAGVARQLPAVQRALGREPVAIDERLFAIAPLLTGDEIASLLSIDPGPRIGAVKRALVEAQVRGEIATREEAERFVTAAAR